MSDIIKVILDDLRYTAKKHTIQVLENGGKIEHCPQEVASEMRLNSYSANILLDYITKLEQSCCEYKCICNGHQVNCILETLHDMGKKNKRLNNIIDEIEAIVYADISNIDCRISIQEKLDKLKELEMK